LRLEKERGKIVSVSNFCGRIHRFQFDFALQLLLRGEVVDDQARHGAKEGTEI